jgi:hypothetical protein
LRQNHNFGKLKLNTIILFSLFSSFTSFALGQVKTEHKDYLKPNLNFSFGLVMQSRVWGEIGINYGTIHQFVHGPFGNTLLVRLSAEFTFVENVLLVAPKIGIEKSIHLLNIRASIVRYTKSDITEFRFTPEIVFELQELSFAFGWSIPFAETKLGFIPNTKFSALVNF